MAVCLVVYRYEVRASACVRYPGAKASCFPQSISHHKSKCSAFMQRVKYMDVIFDPRYASASYYLSEIKGCIRARYVASAREW